MPDTTELLTLLATVEVHLLRIVNAIGDLRTALNRANGTTFDGFDAIPPTRNQCRHFVPVGDWCSYCAETPEG